MAQVVPELIGLDFDGVVVDTVWHRCAVCIEVYGVDPPFRSFAAKTVVSEGRLTQQQYDDLMDLVFVDPRYAMMMEPLCGAIGAIHSLIAAGLTPRIVTMRQAASVKFVRRFLRLDEVQLGGLKVVSTNRQLTKHQHVAGMLAFVEDRVEHLATMKGIVPNLYLMDYYGVAEPADWYTLVPDWPTLLPQLVRLA